MAPVRHPRSAFAAAYGLCLLLATGVAAQEKVAWLSDRAAGIAQARKQGKLLLVVQLTGDFAKNAADSGEAKTYRAAALADSRVAQALSERFVVVHQQAGEAEALRKLHAAKTQPVRTEFAATYVCLPDLRVIHFIPGFLSSAELLAELQWAEKCYAGVATAAGEDELAARRAHLAAIAPADLPLLLRSYKSRWAGDALAGGPSTVDLPAALTAARGALEWSLAQRLGKSWQRTPAQEAVNALAAHGTIGRELAHLVLSEFPLVPLGDIERPAFEACTGDRFWQASRRRESLASWWASGVGSAKPLLLVVADDIFSREANDSHALVWPPVQGEPLPLLGQFTTTAMSLDEFAALASDAGLDPLTYRAAAPPRYAVFAAGGKLSALLNKSASLARLAQAMSAAAGAGASAAIARGDSADAEK